MCVGVSHSYGVGSTVGSAVGSTVGSVVGCFGGSEIMVTNMQRYIFKNHFCCSVLHLRNKIPVGVGVCHGSTVGSTVGSAVGSMVVSVVGCCAGSEVTVI